MRGPLLVSTRSSHTITIRKHEYMRSRYILYNQGRPDIHNHITYFHYRLPVRQDVLRLRGRGCICTQKPVYTRGGAYAPAVYTHYTLTARVNTPTLRSSVLYTM